MPLFTVLPLRSLLRNRIAPVLQAKASRVAIVGFGIPLSCPDELVRKSRYRCKDREAMRPFRDWMATSRWWTPSPTSEGLLADVGSDGRANGPWDRRLGGDATRVCALAAPKHGQSPITSDPIDPRNRRVRESRLCRKLRLPLRGPSQELSRHKDRAGA